MSPEPDRAACDEHYRIFYAHEGCPDCAPVVGEQGERPDELPESWKSR